MAYVLPVRPPMWLVEAVRDVERGFVDLFEEEVALAGEGLANVNLDTGRPDLGEREYGGLRRSIDLLDDLGGVLPPCSATSALEA